MRAEVPCPHRLGRPRTSALQAGNASSNLAGGTTFPTAGGCTASRFSLFFKTLRATPGDMGLNPWNALRNAPVRATSTHVESDGAGPCPHRGPRRRARPWANLATAAACAGASETRPAAEARRPSVGVNHVGSLSFGRRVSEWDREIDNDTTTSEISSRTPVGPEMSAPVGVRPTTRRSVGNTSHENDAWSKQSRAATPQAISVTSGQFVPTVPHLALRLL